MMAGRKSRMLDVVDEELRRRNVWRYRINRKLEAFDVINAFISDLLSPTRRTWPHPL